MMKNKSFIIINVFGMGIAVACCIVAYFAFEFDNTFDRVHKNRDSIYRVTSTRQFESTTSRFARTPLPLGEIVGKTFSDVNHSSRLMKSWSNFKLEDNLFAANLLYVDADFFTLFTFDFIAGNGSALLDKSSTVISEKMASRLFGTPQEAYGKTITQILGNKLKEVRIAGVFREPAQNSSFFNFDGSAYMPFENYKDEFPHIAEDDWRQDCMLFVQVKDPARVQQVMQQLQPFLKNNNAVRNEFQLKEFTLDSFATMAYTDRAENVQPLVWNVTWAAPPLASIVATMIMSVLILLIACFNLTNTAIAISSRRLKEIGVRKVMGSMRLQLIIQFIGETTAVCFLALVVGLALSDFLVAGWNFITSNFIHLDSHYLDTPGFIFFLCAVLLFTGIIAGAYPAFYISRFKPVAILKGKLKFGGTNYFTRTLLAMQFAISLIAIVSAFAFLQNARYQKELDLGFDARGTVIAWVDNESEFDSYRNALQENPKILSVAGARSGIFSNPVHSPVKDASREIEVDVIEVGDNYLKTMGLELLDGRDFLKDSQTDQKESIIITQKMADLFGWDKPLGKEIIWSDSVKLYVVGVIKDAYTQGLWKELDPIMIRYVSPDKYNHIVVSTSGENLAEVNVYMTDQWKKVFPNRLYNGYLVGSILAQSITLSWNIMTTYVFIGGIALLLSITGLYTLVSLNIIKRTKEIGLRKIAGASIANIASIVNKEFIIILGIASIMGVWAGYTWCNTLMDTIWKYHHNVNGMTFLPAVGLLFLVSFIIIGVKVFTIANLNPVKTLRDE